MYLDSYKMQFVAPLIDKYNHEISFYVSMVCRACVRDRSRAWARATAWATFHATPSFRVSVFARPSLKYAIVPIACYR